MRVRVLLLLFVIAATGFGQRRRFSWQDACFKNPSAPYCQGRDFGIQPAAEPAATNPSVRTPKPRSPGERPARPALITLGRIDWNFADPLADLIAGFNFGKLADSPLARDLIAQFTVAQALSEADTARVFDGLSSLDQGALSVRGGQIVVLVTGGMTDLSIPGLQAGWKAAPLAGNTLLIGSREAVDQAAERVRRAGPLTGAAQSAEQWQSSRDFWASGNAMIAGPQAAVAGLMRFSLGVAMTDQLTTDAILQYSSAPDASMIPAGATIQGNSVSVRTSMGAGELREKFAELQSGPAGRLLGPLLKAALSVPAPDPVPARANKPVIYGLDGGPRVVNQ